MQWMVIKTFLLPALLAVSVLLNLKQWQWRVQLIATQKAEVKLAEERARVQATQEALNKAEELNSEVKQENKEIREQLEKISIKTATLLATYDKKLKSLPVPVCPPGKERMSLVNELLRDDP